MTRRRSLALFLAITLAFAAGGAPRYAHAAVQGHGHATAGHGSAHEDSSAGHAHATSAGDFGAGGAHDHAGAAPSDQGCCYAWCNSVAVAQISGWVFAPELPDTPFLPELPFLIAALASALDPPPR